MDYSPAVLMLVKPLATEIFLTAEILGTVFCSHHSRLHCSLFDFQHQQVTSNFKFSASLPLGLIFALS